MMHITLFNYNNKYKKIGLKTLTVPRFQSTAFIKPFEVPQRSVKIKIQVNFSFDPVSRCDWLISGNTRKFVLIKSTLI